MRTRSLFLAAAALAMAGCSQNTVMETNPDARAVMKFGVYTGVQTKGTETNTAGLKTGGGFGFLAYKTSGWTNEKGGVTPDFLYNENGTWDNSGSAWKYTNTRFWPTNSDKITFFAYAPYEATPDGTSGKIKLSGKTDTGAPILEFEVNNTDGTINWDAMVDLVTDCRTDIQDMISTSGTPAGTVKFKFSHVLTKVADIQVKASEDLGANTRIFVTGLKLDPGSALPKRAKYKFDDNSWEELAAPQNFSASQDLEAFLNKADADFNGYTTKSVEVSGQTTVSLFHANKDNPAKALYFIPVNGATGTGSEGDLKLKLSYDLVMKASDGTGNVTSSVSEKEISLPANTFKQGYAHTYTLTITMNSIKIDVDDDFETWGNGGTGDVTVNP